MGSWLGGLAAFYQMSMNDFDRKRGLSTVIELSGSERHDGVHLG